MVKECGHFKIQPSPEGFVTGITIECPDCKHMITFLGNDTIYHVHKLYHEKCPCTYCVKYRAFHI